MQISTGMIVLYLMVHLYGELIAIVNFHPKPSPGPVLPRPSLPCNGPSWENMKFSLKTYEGIMVLYLRLKLDGESILKVNFHPKTIPWTGMATPCNGPSWGNIKFSL